MLRARPMMTSCGRRVPIARAIARDSRWTTRDLQVSGLQSRTRGIRRSVPEHPLHCELFPAGTISSQLVHTCE